MDNKKKEVVVIGSGIIGTFCAYELSKRGIQVTVIDQSEPGSGCSHANAGWITPCFALPLAMPGMLSKSLKWLFNSSSPLYIKPEPSVTLFKWLLRFIQSMHPQTAASAVGVLTELSKYSLEAYIRLASEFDHSLGFERKGLLFVNQTQQGLRHALEDLERMSAHGITGQSLSVDAVRLLEPAITGKLAGGIYYPQEAHLEPLGAIERLVQLAKENGAKFLNNVEAYDFQIKNKEIISLRTTQGDFTADSFVLATGSWSYALGKRLGVNIPILGGKGYSMTIPSLKPSPQIPIMISERKIAITPRNGSIRIAGTLELVNQDDCISPKRVEAVLTGAKTCLSIPEAIRPTNIWRGLRPCTPDGIPIIGIPRQIGNLLVVSGHQMLGMQTAPATGRLAADLLLGEKPPFDPRPFRVNRF